MVKLLLSLFLSFSFIPKKNNVSHPLYVSITDATYNAKEKSVEIISKIFLDDFENVLQKQYNTKVDLFAEPTEASKTQVLGYLQKHLQYIINDKVTSYTIVGYERKKDACWVYLEITNVSSISKVTINNNILHEFSEKQINLIHFANGSTTKSHKFNYPDRQVSFSF